MRDMVLGALQKCLLLVLAFLLLAVVWLARVAFLAVEEKKQGVLAPPCVLNKCLHASKRELMDVGRCTG